MSWRSESPFTVGFRAYVGFWFHCSPNPKTERALHSKKDAPVRKRPPIRKRVIRRVLSLRGG
ncbi:hypothetical protein ECC04_017210 [Pseudomonas aeruginosa]|nr:hypothetical protein ECC04_017210 [Pseudomonas aeruginosa]